MLRPNAGFSGIEQKGAPGMEVNRRDPQSLPSSLSRPLGVSLSFSISSTVAHRSFLKTLSRECHREINSWSINSQAQPGSLHAGSRPTTLWSDPQAGTCLTSLSRDTHHPSPKYRALCSCQCVVWIHTRHHLFSHHIGTFPRHWPLFSEKVIMKR